MKIKQISADDLRRMENQEGLILQGCGGDLREWVDGINELLMEEGILLDGSRLEDVSAFEHDGATCLLFWFGGQHMDTGKLALWRIQTHGQFGGTWLSDFVPNRLGGFLREQQKPDCELIGQDGNVHNLIALAARTLRRNGMEDQEKEMTNRIIGGECGSYEEAMNIIGEYVNITGPEEQESITMKM